ncbi:hypothetical protein CASFOL_026802 [Castilleja foliolosa]|uniref:Peptidase A1 domain-containing protein n=1 Tax=Castilleja foliolosa TaxID=1961234 RepID=A0ABD3CI29_9LAMI
MTTLNCFFHLMMIFKLYSSLLLILFSYIQVKSLALESRFETVETAPDQCKRHFIDPEDRAKSTLEVFHRNGPCSPTAGTNPMKMPSAQDILHRDRLRVESLQARLKLNSTTNKYDSRFQDTKEVAYLPVLASTSNYAISIGLGTPRQMQTLEFDTGSDLTWTRGFHYYASTTFVSISCVSKLCTWYLPSHTCEMFGNRENMCYYDVTYKDASYTKGVFSMDTLHITQTGDVFPDFHFGCGTEIEGDFGDGILGLGRNLASFVTQTQKIYKRVFSYCLPSSPSSTGFLKLGPTVYPDNMKFTPLIDNSDYPSFYFIDIISIKVGDVELLIDKFDLMYRGTIIDSGTVITRLPMRVYRAMRNVFRKQMRDIGYQIIAFIPSNWFDTCYIDSEHLSNDVPNITFTFKGGVIVDMDYSQGRIQGGAGGAAAPPSPEIHTFYLCIHYHRGRRKNGRSGERVKWWRRRRVKVCTIKV